MYNIRLSELSISSFLLGKKNETGKEGLLTMNLLPLLAVDRLDTEANVHTGPVLRLPFASLFDTLGM